MASFTALLSSTTLFLLLLVPKLSADPDQLQDFCIADTSSPTTLMNGLPCINPNKASANHFTSSALSMVANTSGNPLGISVILLTPQILPGINTLGISMARIDMAAGGVAPPHTHPRATEIVFILRGKLIAGFVDSTNKLFSHVVKTGDVFVFPKGTLHFLQNIGGNTASIIAAFNSQNPGSFLIPFAAFASNPAIPGPVLAKGFQISLEEVGKIRMGLGGH
ncbi:germin-like protein 1-1 [Cryptomeria japonica]|uniref:germin-like protein 1-1 n=1 Tax=Cryptomeria japonica TaxID=3369 RepID=UPI0027DA8F9A|nr:germin-like protein 1-1 [Cryptomeria japonica]